MVSIKSCHEFTKKKVVWSILLSKSEGLQGVELFFRTISLPIYMTSTLQREKHIPYVISLYILQSRSFRRVPAALKKQTCADRMERVSSDFS